MYKIEPWSIWAALPPLLAFVAALVYALYILSYPPRQRKLSLIPLAALLLYSFNHHLYLTPWYTLNDTFGRFLYIWFFHMSNVVTIVQHAPSTLPEKATWRTRLQQAYQVLFLIHIPSHEAGTPSKPTKHGYTRRHFVVHHVLKAALCYAFMRAWEYYATSISPRLPLSDTAGALLSGFVLFVDWIFYSWAEYESIHSVFAALFVGILRLDRPEAWRLSLCNSILEAWSVRRYWGKHWHSYVYYSFTAQTKVVTRGWLGLKRGRLQTRILENTVVFFMSGLAHSAVRWVQDPETDCWAITWWYVGQMVPIVLEGVVQDAWRRVRKALGISADEERVDAAEKVVGYIWTIAWFWWSVSMYTHTRDEWGRAKFFKKYEAEWAAELAQAD